MTQAVDKVSGAGNEDARSLINKCCNIILLKCNKFDQAIKTFNLCINQEMSEEIGKKKRQLFLHFNSEISVHLTIALYDVFKTKCVNEITNLMNSNAMSSSLAYLKFRFVLSNIMEFASRLNDIEWRVNIMSQFFSLTTNTPLKEGLDEDSEKNVALRLDEMYKVLQDMRQDISELKNEVSMHLIPTYTQWLLQDRIPQLQTTEDSFLKLKTSMRTEFLQIGLDYKTTDHYESVIDCILSVVPNNDSKKQILSLQKKISATKEDQNTNKHVESNIKQIILHLEENNTSKIISKYYKKEMANNAICCTIFVKKGITSETITAEMRHDGIMLAQFSVPDAENNVQKLFFVPLCTTFSIDLALLSHAVAESGYKFSLEGKMDRKKLCENIAVDEHTKKLILQRLHDESIKTKPANTDVTDIKEVMKIIADTIVKNFKTENKCCDIRALAIDYNDYKTNWHGYSAQLEATTINCGDDVVARKDIDNGKITAGMRMFVLHRYADSSVGVSFVRGEHTIEKRIYRENVQHLKSLGFVQENSLYVGCNFCCPSTHKNSEKTKTLVGQITQMGYNKHTLICIKVKYIIRDAKQKNSTDARVHHSTVLPQEFYRLTSGVCNTVGSQSVDEARVTQFNYSNKLSSGKYVYAMTNIIIDGADMIRAGTRGVVQEHPEWSVLLETDTTDNKYGLLILFDGIDGAVFVPKAEIHNVQSCALMAKLEMNSYILRMQELNVDTHGQIDNENHNTTVQGSSVDTTLLLQSTLLLCKNYGEHIRGETCILQHSVGPQKVKVRFLWGDPITVPKQNIVKNNDEFYVLQDINNVGTRIIKNRFLSFMAPSQISNKDLKRGQFGTVKEIKQESIIIHFTMENTKMEATLNINEIIGSKDSSGSLHFRDKFEPVISVQEMYCKKISVHSSASHIFAKDTLTYPSQKKNNDPSEITVLCGSLGYCLYKNKHHQYIHFNLHPDTNGGSVIVRIPVSPERRSPFVKWVICNGDKAILSSVPTPQVDNDALQKYTVDIDTHVAKVLLVAESGYNTSNFQVDPDSLSKYFFYTQEHKTLIGDYIGRIDDTSGHNTAVITEQDQHGNILKILTNKLELQCIEKKHKLYIHRYTGKREEYVHDERDKQKYGIIQEVTQKGELHVSFFELETRLVEQKTTTIQPDEKDKYKFNVSKPVLEGEFDTTTNFRAKSANTHGKEWKINDKSKAQHASDDDSDSFDDENASSDDEYDSFDGENASYGSKKVFTLDTTKIKCAQIVELIPEDIVKVNECYFLLNDKQENTHESVA